MRNRAIPLLLFAAAAAAAPSLAQVQQSPVRYHLGDDTTHDSEGRFRYSTSEFNDSAWPIVAHGTYPVPAFSSDGIVWLRMRLEIPAGAHGPLVLSLHHFPDSQQVYADGVAAGLQGQLPPNARATAFAITAIPLPIGTNASPASGMRFVLIAIRAWYGPQARLQGGTQQVVASIGPRDTVLTQDRNAHAAEILRRIPAICVHALLFLIGVGLVFLWRWSRRPDLGLFALFLLTNACYYILFNAQLANSVPLSYTTCWLALAFFGSMAMMVVVEFARQVYDLPSRWFRFLGHALWAADLALSLLYIPATEPRTWLPSAIAAERAFSLAWDLLIVGACLVTMARRQRNWLIALCMMIVAAILAVGSAVPRLPGWFDAAVTFAVANVCLVAAGSLIAQALRGWMNANRIAAELDAARETQQRLVPPSLPAIAGFNLATAYLPATEVGGDFYQVLPQPGGAMIIALGDVSGKGLKAAMTGVLAIGVLRTLAAEALGPAQLLNRLSRELLRAQQGGFVTCLVLRVEADGTVTMANAGHLPPYLDGKEVALDNGLPLGLVEEAPYAEMRLTLPPGARITLLTDGVLEARDASGQLFGFDRTAAISTQSAEAIAQAAKAFGQEDDITVLTLTFASAEVLHA